MSKLALYFEVQLFDFFSKRAKKMREKRENFKKSEGNLKKGIEFDRKNDNKEREQRKKR